MNIRKLKLKKDFTYCGCIVLQGTILFDYQWAQLIGRGDSGNMIDLEIGSDKEWWEEVK